ncbi:hypothetical protein [Pseudonocardia oroxyli]|uniref:Uncharacterized protein n=1 Tax=Pseudonocardia oroxyli TaxID=366584 RepID=A0A1G8BE18_PSEOR|nr:hypothetical protein [Pseudonocardia oroxyli]SDH31341.1 hypothetical protein SAMN05216377_12111 [Pseudonocardia oroxyli]
MSAQDRARLHLTATTTANGEDVLKHVKMAASRVKGGGASLLTTGAQNIGAQVNVEKETAEGLSLSITSGRRLVELCTFDAVVTSTERGARLTVGGLQTYKTTQSTVMGFIPVGPKAIAGYAPYKRLLDEVAAELRSIDPSAEVTIG